MKIKKLISLVLVMFFLVLGGCSKKEGEEKVLAKIGKERITVEDVEARIAQLNPYYYDYFSTPAGKKQLIEQMVTEKLLIAQARKEKLDKTPEFQKQLKETEEQMLLQSAISQLSEKEIVVSTDDIKTYYDSHIEEFVSGEERKASHILVNTKEEAEEVVKELKSGADFAEVARQKSQDTMSAQQGGDLGYVKRGEMTPNFETALFSLKEKGEISAPVETPYGFHIIKLTDIQKLPSRSFEEVQEEIRNRMINEKFAKKIEDLKKEFKVEVNYQYLDEISLPSR